MADTHSDPHRDGLRHLAESRPDVVLHGGDIGDLAVLDQLAEIAPVHAVRGNIDMRTPGLPDALVVEIRQEGDVVLRLLLMHIAVLGPRLRADAALLARTANASLVVCGHSHVPFVGTDRGLTIFNPGSIGPRRFHLPILFGLIDFSPTGVRLAHINAETGVRWRPGG